jgi:hypothetical protein
MSDPRTTDTGQKLRRATDRIGQEANEVARAARDEGRRALDDVKSRAADRAEEMARAADAAADELEKSGDASISGYGHSLASMMRQLAGGLRDRDIEDFAAELAQFARRHPAAFLAGSVAVGFGVARVLKAQNGGSLMHRSNADVEFYGDYDEDYGDSDGYDESYEAGEYDSGRYGSEFGSATGYGGSEPNERYGSESESSQRVGGSGERGLYGNRSTSGAAAGSTPSTTSGAASSASSSATSSPTSAPASSGTSSSFDYGTASPDGDRYKSRAGSEDENPIETPESEAQTGPRKGELP